MRIFTVVSEDQLFAELLEISSAIFANAIGIDHASDRSQIPLFEFLYLAANFCNASDDLMTGHTRVGSSIPFIASDVQIGMTYTAKLNVDLHVVRQRIAALERKWFQRFSRRMSSVTFGGVHNRAD